MKIKSMFFAAVAAFLLIATPAYADVAPAMTPAATPAMAAAPAAPAAPAPAPAKSDIPWPTIIMAVGMVLVAVIKILESFGVFKRVVKDPRWTTILNLTKKGTEFFVQFADTTANTWDDALAKILDDINEALLLMGEKALTPEETEKAKASATALVKVAKPEVVKPAEPAA